MEATSATDERRRGRLLLAGLGVALLLHFLNGTWYLPLQEPDEGRYGDIAAAMARTGDWVTPRLNDISYFEKPPMFFWLSGLSIGVLGANEFAARLPSVLACLVTTLLLVQWGWKTSGRRAGLLAGAMLATIPIFALMAHMVMVDLVLTLFTTAALYAAWKGVVEPEPDQPPKRRWILAFWAAAGLACLTKGPIGLALPFVSVAAALGFSRQWRRLGAFVRPDGPALFLLVSAPWYLAMERANPGYLREFFVAQNIERLATGGAFRRNRSFWYYVPVLLTYFLPWTFFLPSAIRSIRWKVKERIDASSRLDFYLACSIAAPFALLSVAHSMLGYYVLPLAPPFALWVGRVVSARWAPGESDPRAWRVRFLALVAAAVLAILLAAAIVPMGSSDLSSIESKFLRKMDDPAKAEYARAMSSSLQSAWPLAAGGCAAAGILLLAGAGFARSGRGLAALAMIAAATAGFEATVTTAGNSAAPIRWSRDIALRARSEARPGEKVVLYGDFLTSVAFHLRRPAIIWTATFAMFGHDIGEAEAQGRALQGTPDALRKLLDGREDVLVITTDEDAYRELQALARGPCDVLERQGNLRLVRHRSLGSR